MSNVLSFPMNALDLKKNDNLQHTTFETRLESEANAEAISEPAVEHEKSKGINLLTSLAYLQECLDKKGSSIDIDTIQSCLSAAKDAFHSALSMERTIINQTLRIEEMSHIASTDQLTGVYNRRGFETEFRRVLSAATRYGETGVLIYVDLDGFKPINDTYGHAAGDEMLVEVGRLLQEHVRPHDMVARLGGDEFAVLLTRTDWEDGLSRAERLKHILNTHYVNWNGKHIAMRASLGFQCYGAHADADALLHKADHAMYQAKRLRNESR